MTYFYSVKQVLSFLLVLLVATAMVTPCCLEDNCTSEVVAADLGDQHKSEESGNCSPFFSCATCGGFASTLKAITLPLPLTLEPQYFEAVFSYRTAMYSVLPWQPPRSLA